MPPLPAFVSPDEEDWRFSLIKMDYSLREDKKERVKISEEFTPAKRWSFLVGSNERSHTAQSQLIGILEKDEINPTLTQLEGAFNVEKVTKEFFEKYRVLFYRTKETLDEVLDKDSKVRSDFENKNINTVDFSKKLLGQIVFLYFLQKKGWFGVARDADWGTGPKNFLRELFDGKHGKYNNFFNDILEPLFYNALRIDRSANDDYHDKFNCKIPFLNGGLFDPIGEYDWVHTDINLTNELFSNLIKTKEGDTGTGILDIFDRYNFTVKEDEPLEKEVAVDPEMLGKVFENLLEVKDRKSKGTYYTPREIVHYMCQQSLINYLDTEMKGKVSKDDIEKLIKYGEQFGENNTDLMDSLKDIPESIIQNAKLIDEKLAEIKACDPAVGSGAFLVSMMGEVVRTRNVLSNYIKDSGRTIYNFKRDCIENSLYGVDIDPGAVEIAKLRLWLSLIVDEDDIKQIKPLPNLDYKIVCGNSLLGVEKNLFNYELFGELEKYKILLFNEISPNKKQEYKTNIDNLIGVVTNGHKEFDFEIYFSEIFHEEKGFDIVIANPPYVEARSIEQEEVDLYRKLFTTAGNRINTFALFTEKGIEITSNQKILSFIIHRNSIRSNDYRKLRKFILDNTKIKKILSFKIGVFENVTGEMAVLVLQKSKDNKGNIIKVDFMDNTISSEINYKSLQQDIFNELPDYRFNIYLNDEIIQILEKLNKNDKLENFGDITQGIIVGDEQKYIINYKKNSKYVPILRGKSISRYRIDFKNEYLYYVPGTKLLTRGKTKDLFEVPEKILTQHVSSRIIAALDKDSFYYLQTINGIISKSKEITNKYLLALLNSRLVNFYYEYTFNMGAEFTTAVAIENLGKLPIKNITTREQQPIIAVVDDVLELTSDHDYLSNSLKQAKVKEYEHQIDQMVYKLYNLKEEEIKIIEEEK